MFESTVLSHFMCIHVAIALCGWVLVKNKRKPKHASDNFQASHIIIPLACSVILISSKHIKNIIKIPGQIHKVDYIAF